MKIIAFGASTSSKSINKRFASFVAEQLQSKELEILDLNNYNPKIYSADEEIKNGIPNEVVNFAKKIAEADVVVISLAEHNGSYSASFKNLFDWTSRYNARVFEGKKVVLLATSPGQRGGKSVLDAALSRFPLHGGEIVGHFSLPSYQENFDEKKGIVNEEIKKDFLLFLNDIKTKLG